MVRRVVSSRTQVRINVDFGRMAFVTRYVVNETIVGDTKEIGRKPGRRPIILTRIDDFALGLLKKVLSCRVIQGQAQ